MNLCVKCLPGSLRLRRSSHWRAHMPDGVIRAALGYLQKLYKNFSERTKRVPYSMKIPCPAKSVDGVRTGLAGLGLWHAGIWSDLDKKQFTSERSNPDVLMWDFPQRGWILLASKSSACSKREWDFASDRRRPRCRRPWSNSSYDLKT